MDDCIIRPNQIKIFENRDPKFYETLASLKIVFDLNQETVTVANLLTQAFDDRLLKYPSKKAVTQHLDLLYGAKTSAQTYAYGAYQIIDISVRTIAPRFTDEDIYAKQLELLAETLYRPLLDENTLSEAKKEMKSEWQHIIENPLHYALIQAYRTGTKDAKIGISTFGNIDEVDQISLADLKAFHRRCVDVFVKEVYVSGELGDNDYAVFDEGQVCQRAKDAIVKTQLINGAREDFYPGSQTQLIFLYKTTITPKDELYSAYLVFIALLGQLPSSLLFQNIREKESLCYSIFAMREIADGVFAILTGIDDRSLTKVESLVEEQFELIKNGAFSIEAAQLFLKQQLDGLDNKVNGMITHRFRNERMNMSSDIETMKKEIDQVEKDDVIRVLETLSEPFIYKYRGENHD